MPKTPDTRQTLYGTSREMLETAERKNEILAEIAGEEYTAPESIPHAQYSIDKRMLAAKQKENELLESIAGGGEGGGGANKLAIDYATDVLSLKHNDTPITGSGVTLPAYGIDYDSGTGGLTLTKNGAPMQGQTVALPPYGAPQKAATAAAMTDTSKVYVYTGSESGYINGNWYYYDDTLEAWTSGGVYNATSFETDKTLSVEDQAADAKKTGEAVSDLKESLAYSDDFYGVYPPAKKIPGYIKNDGTAASTGSYYSLVTDYVPCAEGDVFNYEGTYSATAVSALFYDSSKAIVGNAHSKTITIPSGVVYVRFFSYAANNSDAVLKVASDSGIIPEIYEDIADSKNAVQYAILEESKNVGIYSAITTVPGYI